MPPFYEKRKPFCIKEIACCISLFSTLGPALSMRRKVKDLPIARAHEAIMRAMEKLGKRRFITLATPTVRAKEDKE